MKKKVAILLASVMLAVSSLPMNLLARTQDFTKPQNVMYNYDTGSVMVANTLGAGVANTLAGGARAALDFRSGSWYNDASYTKDILANNGSGMDLVLTFIDAAKAVDNYDKTFYVSLENAYWAFYSAGAGSDIFGGTNAKYQTTYGSYLESRNNALNDDNNAGRKFTLSTTEGVSVDNMLDEDYSGTHITPWNLVADAVDNAFNTISTATTAPNVITDTTTWATIKTNFDNLVDSYINARWSWNRNGVDNPAQLNQEIVAMKAVASQLYDHYFTQALATYRPNGVNYSLTVLPNAATTIGSAFGIPTVTSLASTSTDLYALSQINPYPTTAAGITAAKADSSTAGNDYIILPTETVTSYNNVISDINVNTALQTVLGSENQLEILRSIVDVTDIDGSSATIGASTVDGTPVSGYAIFAIGTDLSNDDNTVTVSTAIAGALTKINTVINIAKTKEAELAAQGTTADVTKLADAKGLFAAIGGNFSAATNNDANAYNVIVTNNVITSGLQAESANVTSANGFLDKDAAGATNGSYTNDVGVYAKNQTNLYGNASSKAIKYDIEVLSATPNVAKVTIKGGQDINVGDVLLIPQVVKTVSRTEQVAYTIQGNNMVSNSVKVISGTGVSLGTTSAKMSKIVDAARGRIYLGDLTITENSANTLQNGYFVIVPPVGYDMVNNGLKLGGSNFVFANAAVGVAGYITFTEPNVSARQAMVVSLANMSADADLRRYAGTLTISGLALTPINNDPDFIANFGDSLSIQVRDGGGSTTARGGSFLYYISTGGRAITGSTTTSGYTPVLTAGNASVGASGTGITTDASNLKVAVRQDWNIGYKAATPTVQRFSGLTNQTSSMITVNEITMDSWNLRKDTTFTLTDADGNILDDVKISNVGIAATNLTNVAGGTNFAATIASGGTTYYYNRDSNGGSTGSPAEYRNASFSRDGNLFRITDLYTTTGALATMNLTFALSANANFTGDVYVTIGGPAVDDNGYTTIQDNGRVLVATFAPPVTISTSPSELTIGFQKYAVADITVTENFSAFNKSSFASGKKIQLAIGEYGKGRLSDYMYFTPINKGDATMGGDDKTFNISEPVLINLGTQRVLEFTVMRKSTTAGGSVSFTNLNLNVDRTVPQGSYDLVVGGDAIVNNYRSPNTSYMYMYDRFDSFGVVEEGYVIMKTEGDAISEKYKITLVPGSNEALIGSEIVDIEYPVMINEDNRTIIPLRSIAKLLGVADDNIVWDDETRTATIFAGERTVQFTENSNKFAINGVSVPMDTAPIIAPEYGRVYIPFKYLLQGLNLPEAEWDPETGNVTINPNK